MSRWSTARSLMAFAVACAALLGLATGCSGTQLTLDSDVGAYDASNANDIAADVREPSWFGSPIEDAADLRHDALVGLRKSGAEGAELADLLTEEFPGEIRSAPYYVASGTFDGADAWFIVEAWGSADGLIDQTRLWVFNRETSHVLYTGAIN